MYNIFTILILFNLNKLYTFCLAILSQKIESKQSIKIWFNNQFVFSYMSMIILHTDYNRYTFFCSTVLGNAKHSRKMVFNFAYNSLIKASLLIPTMQVSSVKN
jgi:hypothetical protein